MSFQQPILVAVIGVGLVGSEFLHQLLSIPEPSPFKLVALSSSTRSIFIPNDLQITRENWKPLLASSVAIPDLQSLSSHLSALVAANHRVALVDNTSADQVASFYPTWLRAGINVVTPNKKAFSGDAHLYDSILIASKESGAKCLHEATVGAGLPIIAPLKELLATGDRITKIEGVFSGTMSYIFNEFSTGSPYGPSFSTIVASARQRGFTEPHPADDLNGQDVARKLIILARIIAYNSPTTLPHLESFRSIQTTSLVPPSLENLPTGDDFIRRLPGSDHEFGKIREASSREGSVLRFVGLIDTQKGIVKAGLEKYPLTHPFVTALSGSDNIVMFYTERYNARPLVIQGPGAGAAVTAMGVLGDLLKLV